MKVTLVLFVGIIASASSGFIRVSRQVNTNIQLDGALAAAGSGWAAESHADRVQVPGAGGWGPNAELVITSAGESVIAQDGTIVQVTIQDTQNASAYSLVSVGQLDEAAEGPLLEASGLEISNAQPGPAIATGEGASAADATTLLTVSRALSGVWGIAKPFDLK